MGNELNIFIEAAEQLEALKESLKKQQGSTTRLQQLVGTLDQLAVQIGKLPVGLSDILNRARVIEQEVNSAAAKVLALNDQIPRVIEHLEKTDVGRSLDSISLGVLESKAAIIEFKQSVSAIGSVVNEFNFAKEGFFKELAAERLRSEAVQDRLNNSVAALRLEFLDRISQIEPNIKHTESMCERSIEDTGRAFELMASAVTNSSERHASDIRVVQSRLGSIQANDLAEIRNDLQRILLSVNSQNAVLDLIARKKGFSF